MKNSTFADITPASRLEFEIIVQIIQRYEALMQKLGHVPQRRSSTLMDLEVAHSQFILDLPALLAAKDGDFAHDVGGIIRNINRETLTVGGCFLPRYAHTALTS